MPSWNELFRSDEHRWKDVYPPLIDFIKCNLHRDDHNILDLGCGAGRHLKYLAENGYAAFGMDISEYGLEACKSLCVQNELIPLLARADMVALPYASNAFDAVISIHVIFHNPKSLILQTISEIKRVLKPGGRTLLTFNSTYSSRYGTGEKLEEGTYIPDIGRDRGIPHHFSDLADLAGLLTGFKVLSVNLSENVDDDHRSSHWIVAARKEE